MVGSSTLTRHLSAESLLPVTSAAPAVVGGPAFTRPFATYTQPPLMGPALCLLSLSQGGQQLGTNQTPRAEGKCILL